MRNGSEEPNADDSFGKEGCTEVTIVNGDPDKQVDMPPPSGHLQKLEAQDSTRSLFQSIRYYPTSVYFILGNEFAERFSFYGMRAVLILYLTSVFLLDDSTAKLVYHLFVAFAYLTPLFGSILADGFWGRYNVILYISILYVIGQALLSISSITSVMQGASEPLSYVSLFIIALATGGIKPNVSSFAADQFPETLARERSQFFSLFYFSINLGSFLSFIITPYLRGQVSCDGRETCFPLAFGVPAIFMLIAFLLFLAGRAFYERAPPKGTVLIEVYKCVCHALKRRFAKGSSKDEPKRDHWLDYASPAFSEHMINNVKTIFGLMVIFSPAIFYACIYDQTGSAWVLQASRMDGQVGRLTILPDQLSAINPLLIICFVPLFEGVLYPFLMKRGFLTKPLKRMLYGLLLCTGAVVISGVVQVFIQQSGPPSPPPDGKEIFFNSHSSCAVQLAVNEAPRYRLDSTERRKAFQASCGDVITWQVVNCSSAASSSGRLVVGWPDCDPALGTFVTLWDNDHADVTHSIGHYPLDQAVDSMTRLQFLFRDYESELRRRARVIIWNDASRVASYPVETLAPDHVVDVRPEVWGDNVITLTLETCDAPQACSELNVAQLPLHMGANYFVAVSPAYSSVSKVVGGYSVSIMWQIPQWVIITTSEMLFYISGLEFAYSEADASLKSVASAIWLMTTFLGNVVVIIVSGGSLFTNLVTETFVYAGLMVLVTIAFVILATRYRSAKCASAWRD